MAALTRGEVLGRIVERTDLDVFTERVLDSFWEQPAFQRLHPARQDVRAWVRWNLDLGIRWLTRGQPPDEADLNVIREHARARAAEGVPPDVTPANFRRAARFAWRGMLEAATDAERPTLVDTADLIFEYVDRVSRIYFEVYESAARSTVASAEEIAAGALLRRIVDEEALLTEDQALADRLGFSPERAARPFVIALPGGSARMHAELATRLRRRRALAVSEGRRVVGLSGAKAPWRGRGLELDAQTVLVDGPPAIGGERGQALDDLRDVVELALARGRRGQVEPGAFLPELLLRRSPRLAAEVRARVYGPLEVDHPALVQTLDVLVEHDFVKGRAADALPVHRNTLRDRIARISELTGVDLESADGRGLAWLAWLAGRDGTPGPED